MLTSQTTTPFAITELEHNEDLGTQSTQHADGAQKLLDSYNDSSKKVKTFPFDPDTRQNFLTAEDRYYRLTFAIMVHVPAIQTSTPVVVAVNESLSAIENLLKLRMFLFFEIKALEVEWKRPFVLDDENTLGALRYMQQSGGVGVITVQGFPLTGTDDTGRKIAAYKTGEIK